MSFRGFNFRTDSSNSSSSDLDSNDESNDLSSLFTNLNLKTTLNMSLPGEQVNSQGASAAAVETPVLKKEYLNMIPDFYGESELLPRFIEICEKLVKKFYNTRDVNDFQNEYLMSSILAKIKGEAAKNISTSIITNWTSLKTALVNGYADRRDCYSLGIEMTELKQTSNETPFDYYNKIQKLLNLQISYLATHISEAETLIISQYCRMYALRVLLRGLREPIGSLMRTKNPGDLNTALNMLTNDFQLEINQQKLYSINKHSSKANLTKQNYPQLQFTNFPQNNNYNRQSLFPSKSNFQNKDNTSQNKSINVFKPNPNQRFQKPTPMSISTRNTYEPKAPSQKLRPNLSNYNQSFSPNFNNLHHYDQNHSFEDLHYNNTDPSENIQISEIVDDNSNSESNEHFLEENASETESN